MDSEINLIKFRDKAYKLKIQVPRKQKYVLFLDLKAAYDSVNHDILFQKLEKFNIDEDVINSIKKIYSSSILRLSPKSDLININQGVLQGSLISPILFNLYINDLIEELSKIGYDVLGYADDIAVLCEDEYKLIEAIDIIQNWSTRNKILVNKKKSGIMVLNDTGVSITLVREYPIIKEYKYLGVMINNRLLP